jgi:hypothetical protein
VALSAAHESTKSAMNFTNSFIGELLEAKTAEKARQ